MASSSLDSGSWHTIKLDELTKILEQQKTNGEKKLKDLRERRELVKERQEFLQQRRIARLKMEGIHIDMEAVRRRCKAPKESLWYEDVSDEEEKKKLMQKRLKYMYKTQNSESCIKERPDSAESNESVEKKEPEEKEDVKPQRGQVLRNYTKMNVTGDEKTKSSDKTAKHSPRNASKTSTGDKSNQKARIQKAAVKVSNVNKMISGRANIPSPILGVRKLSARKRMTPRNSSDSRPNSPAPPGMLKK